LNVQSIIAELEAERNRLDQAITALQGRTRRKGRPPSVGSSDVRSREEEVGSFRKTQMGEGKSGGEK